MGLGFIKYGKSPNGTKLFIIMPIGCFKKKLFNSIFYLILSSCINKFFLKAFCDIWIPAEFNFGCYAFILRYANLF